MSIILQENLVGNEGSCQDKSSIFPVNVLLICRKKTRFRLYKGKKYEGAYSIVG